MTVAAKLRPHVVRHKEQHIRLFLLGVSGRDEQAEECGEETSHGSPPRTGSSTFEVDSRPDETQLCPRSNLRQSFELSSSAPVATSPAARRLRVRSFVAMA